MEKLGYIYLLKSPSGKVYVGQTWNFRLRMNTYRCNTTNGSPLLRCAITKYGFNSFISVIIDTAITQADLNEKEIKWINYYDSINTGYNLREGGANGKHSKETKLKCSIANKGIRRSPDTEFKKGHNISVEMLRLNGIKISNRKKGIPLTEEHKIALKKAKDSVRGKTWIVLNNKRVWVDKLEIAA